MAADGLVTQEAMASASVVLIKFSPDISASAPEGSKQVSQATQCIKLQAWHIICIGYHCKGDYSPVLQNCF